MARSSLGVLIVEDEVLLVMDMEAMVEDNGHVVVAEATSLDEVKALDGIDAPHVAFVDIQLAHGSSGIEVAKYIQARWDKTVVVFVTANLRLVPRNFEYGHGAIHKPFTRSGVAAALAYLAEGILDPPPTAPAPEGLLTFPALESRFT